MKNTLFLLLILLVGMETVIPQSGCVNELATIQDNTTVLSIGVKDRYLYVNPGSPIIKIYDISNPELPFFVSQHDYSGNLKEHMDIHGEYLYVYGGPENELIVFDISNPLSPVEMGRLLLSPLNEEYWSTGHLENYTYFTAGDSVYVVNTVDKNNLFFEHKIYHPVPGIYGLRTIFVSDKVLYIGAENGIHIFDNSSQEMPVFVGQYPYGRISLTVDTINNLLFTGQHWSSNINHFVSKIDDPFNPDLFGQGTGGDSPAGSLLFNNGILIQTGVYYLNTHMQPVSFYKIQNDTSYFVEDFWGSVLYQITDLETVDSLFIVSKNGGIEILEYDCEYPVGIEVPGKEDSEIGIYPNPTNGNLTIDVPLGLSEICVEFADTFGRVLLERKLKPGNQKVSLSKFNRGIYFVSVFQNGRIIKSEKIIRE